MVIVTVMSLKSALTPENMNFYVLIIHIKPFNPLTEKNRFNPFILTLPHLQGKLENYITKLQIL